MNPELSYQDRKDIYKFEWQMQRVFCVYETLRKILKDYSFVAAAAEAFAYNVYDNKGEEGCPVTGMSYTDALCILHYSTNRYKDELDSEFNEFLMDH